MSFTSNKTLPITSALIQNPEIKQSLKESKSSLKLWQIALAIGIPSAAIIAYLIYKRQRSNTQVTKPTDKKKSDQSLKERELNEEKPQVKKSALEQAVDAKNEGNKYFQQKKYTEALVCYTQAIELCPKSDRNELPKFYQNRAAAFENLKDYEKVIEDCEAALSIDPNYTKALLRRAKAAELCDKLLVAFEDLTALCILEKFNNSSTIMNADRIVKKLGEQMASDKFKSRKSVQISKHFVNNFFIALNKDPVYRNEEFLNDLKANEEENKEMLAAVNCFAEGDYDGCIAHCSFVIDTPGEIKCRTEALNLRASIYMLRCQYKEALDDFNRILDDEAASNRIKSNTLIKLTALNLQKGEESEAFANYDKAIELDPDNEDIYCNRAQVLAMKGRFDESFRDFDKSLELNADHKIAKLQKAFFQFRKFYAEISANEYNTAYGGMNNNNSPRFSKNALNKIDEETKKLEELLAQYADVPEAFSLYAQILSEQEKYEKAEKYYKLALEKDPSNAALLVQRALNTMTWKNEFDEASNMLTQATEMDNTCEFAFETLATVEIQRFIFYYIFMKFYLVFFLGEIWLRRKNILRKQLN